MPSASVSRSPRVIGPGLAATIASVDERMPLLIHGLVSRGGTAPKIHTLSPGVPLTSESGTARNGRSALSSTRPVTSSRPSTVASTRSPVARRHLHGGRVADDRGARQDLAAVPHADPARLPGAVRVLGRDEHEPGCDDVGQARHGRVVGPELLLGRHRGGIAAAVVEGAEQRRGRRSRRSRPARPPASGVTKRPTRARRARRRSNRAQLGRVDPDAVHAVRRRAAGPVVLGPHRIVVSPEVAAVAAIVVPIVGRALVVLITRGPHRCESNDATPDRDRGRGAAPTPRTEDRSGFLDCRTCPYRPPSPSRATGSC